MAHFVPTWHKHICYYDSVESVRQSRALREENSPRAFIVHGGVTVPSKPKKPCAYPGCPALVTGRYCEEHARKANSDYEKFSRDKNTKRRYGRAWKRIRDKYAAEHPFCEKCYEHGVLVPVEEIHHKLPLSEGGTHDRSNLIALCKSCHSQIHAKRGDRWHDR